MRRSLGVRLATIVFVVSLALPAVAAQRDDTPIDRFERAIDRIMSKIRQILPLDLIDINLPK